MEAHTSTDPTALLVDILADLQRSTPLLAGWADDPAGLAWEDPGVIARLGLSSGEVDTIAMVRQLRAFIDTLPGVDAGRRDRFVAALRAIADDAEGWIR